MILGWVVGTSWKRTLLFINVSIASSSIPSCLRVLLSAEYDSDGSSLT